MKMQPFIVMACTALLLLPACKKERSTPQSPATAEGQEASVPSLKSSQATKMNTFYGPQVHVGDGKVRSYVIISHAGVPQEIGFLMTSDAFNGLPTSGENSFIIPLHQKANNVTPYDHLELDWNPNGHPPPNVYTVPHFDFHFYMISLAEQMAIPAYGPTTAALFDHFPPPGYLPVGYFPGPGGVPQMGKHWLNANSPELSQPNPQPFTKTFIYGTYDGRVIFHEPMVTRALLLGGGTYTSPIPQPLYVSPTGTYYPTTYTITADAAGNHYVSLGDFVWR